MKVGDIVRQGNGVVKFKGKNWNHRFKRLGVVISIREGDLFPPQWKEQANLKAWSKLLGRAVDVLWDNGHLSENFAENSLEVVNSAGIDDILDFRCTLSMVQIRIKE